MDLKQVLNPDSSNDKHASVIPQKRPLPPPLTTRQPTSQQNVPPYESPNRITPTVAYSPNAPHSANSHVTTPHSLSGTSYTSPYHRHAPLPSPSGTVQAPSYFAPGQRPSSNHSLTHNSSSPYEQRTYNPIPSPSARRELLPHQIAPAPSYPSQPRTPLGPPSLPRGDSAQLLRESPLPYGRHVTTSSGNPHEYINGPPRPVSHSHSTTAVDQSATHSHLNGSPEVTRLGLDYVSRRKSSMSISPKTVLEPTSPDANLPPEPVIPPDSEQLRRSLSMGTPVHSEQPSSKPSISAITPIHSEPATMKPSVATTMPTNPEHAFVKPGYPDPRTIKPSFSEQLPPFSEPSSMKPSVSSASTTTHDIEPMAQSSTRPSFPATQDPKPPGSKLTASASRKRSAAETPPQPVSSKRPRVIKDPPIWAQTKKGLRPIRREAQVTLASSLPTATTPDGQAPVGAQQAGNPIADRGWEPAFTNIVPFESVTREVTNFLFSNMISSSDPMAPFEIEAKIGHICDYGTRDRISIPVSTEAILGHQNEVHFESQLQIEQHAAINEMLNKALLESKRPSPINGKPRIPMEYKHTRQIDTFYILPVEEIRNLPPSVQHYVRLQSGRRPPRVRVTRDEKTGEIIAAIVKTRVADLHVFCANNGFDWRISVNLEHKYEGDISGLNRETEPVHQPHQQLMHNREPVVKPERRKDRVSYTHQFCQIDLTQVKAVAKDARPGHELEVEIDAEVLREQGRLAVERKPNRFEDYVKVFLDNVRILARAVPPSLG